MHHTTESRGLGPAKNDTPLIVVLGMMTLAALILCLARRLDAYRIHDSIWLL